MKKMNKKGFTIVELVIVIAVIAILAGVMIPTFSDVVTKANRSAAIQKARNTHSEYIAKFQYDSGSMPDSDIYYIVETKNGTPSVVVHFAGGTFGDDTMTAVPPAASTAAGAVTKSCN